MLIRDIDLRLQRYTAAEHRIGANLQELEQHSVYQLLQADTLEGRTAAAFAAADADPGLWDMFALLGSTLSRARALRGTGTRLPASTREQLGSILRDRSIMLSTANVPLGERDLTGAGTVEQRVSIDEMIQRMRDLYEPLRDAVSASEQVLRRLLPRLESAEQTLARLRADADRLALGSTELDRIADTIHHIRDLSLTDPMSIPDGARATLDDAVRSAAQTIAAARTSHDELAADLAAATELLDDCRELIREAMQWRDDAIRKIAQPGALRRPPSVDAVDGAGGLAERLDPILASTAPWQSVRAQLDAWATGAERLRSQLRRVVEANRAPLDRRDELRGRLTAFRAKMAALGRSEDLELADLGDEAHSELYTAPSDLGRAERLVTEFGTRLATR